MVQRTPNNSRTARNFSSIGNKLESDNTNNNLCEMFDDLRNIFSTYQRDRGFNYLLAHLLNVITFGERGHQVCYKSSFEKRLNDLFRKLTKRDYTSRLGRAEISEEMYRDLRHAFSYLDEIPKRIEDMR